MLIFLSTLSLRSWVGRTRPQNARVKGRERVKALMGVASTRSLVAILKTLIRTTGAPPQASPALVTTKATQTPLPSSNSSCRVSTLQSSSVSQAPQLPPPDHLHLQPQPLHCPHRSPRQRPPLLYLPSLCPRQARCLSSSQEHPYTLKGSPLHIHLWLRLLLLALQFHLSHYPAHITDPCLPCHIHCNLALHTCLTLTPCPLRASLWVRLRSHPRQSLANRSRGRTRLLRSPNHLLRVEASRQESSHCPLPQCLCLTSSPHQLHPSLRYPTHSPTNIHPMCLHLHSPRCLQTCLHLLLSSPSALYPPTILHQHTHLPFSSCLRGNSFSLPQPSLQFSPSPRVSHHQPATSLLQPLYCHPLQQPHTQMVHHSRLSHLILSIQFYLQLALPHPHQTLCLDYSLHLPLLHLPPSPCHSLPQSLVLGQAHHILLYTSKRSLWTSQKNQRAHHPRREAPHQSQLSSILQAMPASQHGMSTNADLYCNAISKREKHKPAQALIYQ